ncbi:MAG: glycoside hydrolase family 3 C-terminal domain-containing protein [Clostridiales bacterium]|jgi:beta-glucosidase|nr:glycoside hydrolase family 3 C-terminal domain-containing protein [Clostridiales bacterium]
MDSYKDSSLPIVERIEDLMSRMSLEQKVAQLQCMMSMGSDPSMTLQYFPHGIGEIAVFGGGKTAKETAENNCKIVDYVLQKPLGIPPIIHIEALTGLVGPETTVFPSAIGLGATFAPDTVREMGDIIRKQMLATGFRQALSPVMDVARDPRWGRIGETYGEDPTLAAEMSVAFTKGLQGSDLTEGVAVTGKHFLGYSVTEGGLNMASSPIPARDLLEVYAKPFQAAITEADLQSVMNTYGTIDNEMVIVSKSILNDLLRDEMGFKGMVVSDYMSINRVPEHRLSKDMAEAGIMALKAGLDVECPVPRGYGKNLVEAAQSGDLDVAYIDQAVRRVLETKFKLGLFENPYPHEELFNDAYSNPAFRAQSLKSARQSIVLLKNDGILPLSKNVKKIAVVGPHADSLRMLFGCYTHPASIEMDLGRSKGEMAGLAGPSMQQEPDDDGFIQSDQMLGSRVLKEHQLVTQAMEDMLRGKTPTILEAIRTKCHDAEIAYAVGCEVAGQDKRQFDDAIEAVKNADVAIMTLGGKYGWGLNCTIGEGIDSDNIGLPGIQEEFAREILNVGTPCVLVHMDARPLSSEFCADHMNAIVENWFPGTTGGEALADVLFGDYNPAGRLPVTAARNAGQIPIHVGQKIGNSYFTNGLNMILAKYVEGSKMPLFHFGEGMSYTTFEYSNLIVTNCVPADGIAQICFDVTNTGNIDGEEVAQLYVSDLAASMVRPYMEFAGSKRFFLKAGDTKSLQFDVRADQFAFLDHESKWVVEAGQMAVMVGGSSKNLPLHGVFEIQNSAVIQGKNRGFFAK